MAENAEGQEKSEEPSQKRMLDAREKGQVPRSREFNTFLMMLLASFGLYLLGPGMMRDLTELLTLGFSLERAQLFDTKYILLLLEEQFAYGLLILAPFFVLTMVIAIGSSLLVGGWNFSVKAMAFKGSKMNPLKGVKRIFGPQGLMELVKAIIKVILVGSIAVGLLMWQGGYVIGLGYQSMETALAEVGDKLLWYFIAMSASLVLVAAIDTPFQLWNNKQQLRMSKQEVKQEYKQQEGSPEVKQRVRQIQMEMSQKRMMKSVPEADVVITNPTHYAVALKYDQNGIGAPIVVAKGSDLMAARIREVASHHHVPILSSPALARAVYYSTEVDREIPAALYMAVAKILAYVFSLRDKPGTDFSRPLSYDDVEIPDDYRRDE